MAIPVTVVVDDELDALVSGLGLRFVGHQGPSLIFTHKMRAHELVDEALLGRAVVARILEHRASLEAKYGDITACRIQP